jgi:hypothetical protein
MGDTASGRCSSPLLPAAASGALRRPPTPQASALVVSNHWAGTADLIDPHSFKRVGRLNVVPAWRPCPEPVSKRTRSLTHDRHAGNLLERSADGAQTRVTLGLTATP